MPYFQVMLSGAGILLPFEDASDPAIGFFTTRNVRASDSGRAQVLAKELVLSQWRSGGAYAGANKGATPVLAIESISTIGLLKGIFGRKATGYAFYTHAD
jgi:hypothetical protein